jgi:hypothetical protein
VATVAECGGVNGCRYNQLLEAVCTLATDPAPLVARLGSAVLRVANVELAPISRVPQGWIPPSRQHLPLKALARRWLLRGRDGGRLACLWRSRLGKARACGSRN